MNYQSLARRYLPLAAVIAIQLLIIAVVPSKAANSNTVATSGGSSASQGFSGTGGSGTGGSGGSSTGFSNGGSGSGASGTTGVGTGSGGSGVTGGSGAGGSGSSGGSGSATGSAGSGGSGTGTGGGGGSGAGGNASSGDTTHCAGGREFSPSIDFYAPPCTPGSIGAALASNGGATWEGVTSNQITLVDYISNYGAEVNAIEQAEGLYESYANGQALDAAWQSFINSHYVLWGRKVKIIPYQGQCQSVPPDYSCLEAEMNTIVSTYHPYGVFWNTTLCSACYETLASDHVVAFGGLGFSDQFINANAPYVYSAGESSSRMESMFAQWYCNQLNPYPVQFAPDNNPAQKFTGQKRVLGIISTNDADNESTVQKVLVPALKADCGVSVNHFYFYSQNINTAAQQVEAGISAMDTTTNPATDVLCLCDPVAPEFLYEGEQQHNYWPENLLADTQGMTDDSAAQNYGPSSQVACPLGNPCEFEDAFGLGATSAQEPQANNDATRVFKAGGGGALPVTGIVAETLWENWNEMASLIENTGPDLTPARMQAAAPSMGSIGGGTTGHYQVGFARDDYSWIQDAEVVYWDQNRASPYNGAKGTFVTLEGSRYLPGQYPKGQLAIPGGNNPANRPS